MRVRCLCNTHPTLDTCVCGTAMGPPLRTSSSMSSPRELRRDVSGGGEVGFGDADVFGVCALRRPDGSSAAGIESAAAPASNSCSAAVKGS